MKRVTITVPDEVYRKVRRYAAERDTSVSALVGEFLRSLSDRESEFARLEAQQRVVQERIGRFRGVDRMSRDAVHERAFPDASAPDRRGIRRKGAVQSGDVPARARRDGFGTGPAGA
jgi:predicted CopG family antitoxin